MQATEFGYVPGKCRKTYTNFSLAVLLFPSVSHSVYVFSARSLDILHLFRIGFPNLPFPRSWIMIPKKSVGKLLFFADRGK